MGRKTEPGRRPGNQADMLTRGRRPGPAADYKCFTCGGYRTKLTGAGWEIDHKPDCGDPAARRAERVRVLAAEIHAARCHAHDGWVPMAGCWGPSPEDRAEAERQAAA